MESFCSGVIARAASGTKGYDMIPDREVTTKWGWGLNVVIRDWANDTLKKICIEANTTSILEACYFLERTRLFRGAETTPPSGNNRDYLLRLSTTK